MKTGKITAGVAAVIIGLASPAFFMDCDVVYSEKVYDVRLSADTVNIDINDIPESREVQVGINIDNNPGVIGMAFWVRLDSRLQYDEYWLIDICNRIGVDFGFCENGTVVRTSVVGEGGSIYSNNGRAYNLKLKIPEGAKPGDFYEITPLIDYSGDPGMSQPCFSTENSLDSYFGRENFSGCASGGIRITGQLPPESTPEPTPAPTPVPTPVPTAKPATSSKPVTTVKQTQKPQDVKPSASKSGGSPVAGNSLSSGSDSAAVSESAVSDTEVTSDITSVISSEETTSVQNVTSVSTVTAETCGETSSSEPVTSESVSDDDSSDKKSSGSIAAGLAGITAVAAGFLIYNFRKKGENRK